MADESGSITVVAKHSPLAFLLYSTKFVIEVDGTEHEGSWGERSVAVAPGDHTVRMWFGWDGSPSLARSRAMRRTKSSNAGPAAPGVSMGYSSSPRSAMEIPIHHLDAFVTGGVFTGNPAAVCPLAAWLPDDVMQKIAAENNLSETAFLVGGDGRYQIRWMTPATEVDLCGHATLASAHVVFHALEPVRKDVRFESKSGPLAVRADGERLVLDFPARPPQRRELEKDVVAALGRAPVELWAARDYLAVFATADEVRGLAPDMARLRALDLTGMSVTAPGRGDVDFVSRWFGPAWGIDEDPVTGSAHCTLVPYWSQRLGKSRLHALQVSARGGDLVCDLRGDRVEIGGRVAPYLVGTIRI